MTITKLDRREFLKLGAAAGGGLVLGVYLPGRLTGGDRRAVATADGTFRPNAFLKIDPDGSVTIWMARAEMGQGVRTALPMIVADELDADWSSVRIVQAGAHPEKYGRQMTVGSSSVRRGGWTPLRQAGAAAREMLVAAAAARWGVAAADCRTESGRVHHPASGRSAGYGELADEAATQRVPQDPRLKDPSEFTLIGTSPPQEDTEVKVTGRAGFGADVRVPGMLYATVVRPPRVGGSLARLDDSKARAVPGVRDVFEISAGVAVLADDTWSAFRGAEALEATWSGGLELSSDEIDRHHAELTKQPGAVARDDGDPDAALSSAAHRVEADYAVPYLAHATMEPMNCTAHVRSDGCQVWAPTQNPQGAQRTAAEITGLPLEKVDVHVTYLGCGWGRRGGRDYVSDAVETSKKLGAPVQVVWTREQDMRNDQYRPTAAARLAGGLDARGRLVALSARVAAPPIGVHTGRGRGRGGVDRNAVDGLANAAYGIPNFRVEYCRSELPVPTGYWRSVGPSGNTFILEGFLDELARAAGRDPLELRLEMLDGDPRLKHVLELAASKAGWGTSPPAGRARGIGLVRDKGGRVAQVAEVSLDGDRPRVHRVVVAADCGQLIHPGIVEAQLAGSVIAGLTAAFYGEITLENGRVVQGNFDDYRMLRMPDAPEIEVHLVRNHEEPGGVGEPGVPPIAPAVTNAAFALTGRPIRRLPIRI